MLRLLLPLAAGIAWQWYSPFPALMLWKCGAGVIVLLIAFHFLPPDKKFQWLPLSGGLFYFLFFIAGGLLVNEHDIRNDKAWIGHFEGATLVQLRLEEPLVEKTNSYKVVASVQQVYEREKWTIAKGKVILYLKKEKAAKDLSYGSQVLISKPLLPISNAGNPGSFDYKRYNLFQGITHQVYLTQNDLVVLPLKDVLHAKKLIYESRAAIIQIIKLYITGTKESGLAEALMIGYKQDLDKELVESYTNTGVVHIIAISGLHLGIIYMLLLFITKPLHRKNMHWTRFLVIVAGLWSFSLLAGAQPSVLRSALMFSCMALSTVLRRRNTIYNTMALSAFLLLCADPFWLWNLGFQLSYCAVLSILIFFRPIYHWFYFPNKLIQFFWQLAAVSIAAQILTLPLSIYHFHQFPLLFLLANLVAVPLATLVFTGCILLCIASFIPFLAHYIAIVLTFMIRFMNLHIERLNEVSFAVWEDLLINTEQTILLYLCIAGAAIAIFHKYKRMWWLALGCVLIFIAIRSYTFIQSATQQKLIVYNVPRLQAIDVLNGHQVHFIGSPLLTQDDFLYNFHIRPSRIIHRSHIVKTGVSAKAFQISNRKILIIDTTLQLRAATARQRIDLLVLSGNPKLYLQKVQDVFDIRQVVIDGSVPAWKAKLWKADAAKLLIPCHHVVEKGAFVMNL
ncbi:MAG TPA: ComEC/Rec2 family competence protein [Flavisolibacter sp.]|nr:ComEC/Rec2 family competence protein [Flavisolibacter sp.]